MPSRVFNALQHHPALARPRRKRARKAKPVASPATSASGPAAQRKPPYVPPIRAPRFLTVSARRWHRATAEEAVVPYLRMCGRWLEAHGFPIGGNVHVTVKQGSVILTNDAAASAAASEDLQ
ncbi:MAG TPA: SymE family type I addiction module toxin [Thermoanaerobaculia bacterium]|nr:SymE family type I addiction module toxin [Thermoanaerobaculia bacterium]